MQINASRQQVLQAYAKARQATYFFLSLGAILLLFLAIFQLPCMTILQQMGLSIPFMLNEPIHHFFQPLSWQPLSGWYPLQIIAYYAVVSLLLEIIYIPVAFHIEYTLPQRFKLGTKPRRTILLSIIQKQALLVAHWALLIEIFYLLFVIQPLFWWIEMALLMSLLANIEQWRTPAKIRHSFTVSRLPQGDLERQLRTLLERFSLPAQEIMVIDKPGKKMEANAYILGFGKSRLIGITSTVLKEFPPDEIEVMLAHEIGHHVHHDLLRRPVVRAGIRLLWYAIFAFVLSAATGPVGSSDITTIPFFLMAHLLFYIYGSTTFYKFNRHCEYDADEFALQATGLATAFQHMMIRLANINRIVANPDENRATHPTIVSRIQHAQEFAKRNINAI